MANKEKLPGIKQSSLGGRPRRHPVIEAEAGGIQNKERLLNSREVKVWQTIKSLYVRGLSTYNIAEISGISFKEVGEVIGRISKSRSAPARELVIYPLKRSKESFLDDKRDKEFAKKMFNANWFTENIYGWVNYIKFCQDNNIEIPESDYKRLRGEIFCGAKMLAIMGDEGRLNAYKDMGNSIDKDDKEWFSESLEKEESLFADKLQVEAQKQLNVHVPLGLDENGRVIYDNPQEIVKRVKSRLGIVDQAPEIPSSKEGRH